MKVTWEEVRLVSSTNNRSAGSLKSTWFKRFLSDYGMVLVLAGLCLLFSLLTITEQHPTGSAAAEDMMNQIGKLAIGGFLSFRRIVPMTASFHRR